MAYLTFDGEQLTFGGRELTFADIRPEFAWNAYRLPFYYSDTVEDWEAVTSVAVFADGGRSFYERNTIAPVSWEIHYTGFDTHDPDDAEALEAMDGHYLRQRLSRSFDFHAKNGQIYTDVHYKSYEKMHEGHKSWIQERRIVLVKYP